MKAVYLAVVVMLLVATASADPGCQKYPSCKALGGYCAKSCSGILTTTCDCNRRGLYCCRHAKKG